METIKNWDFHAEKLDKVKNQSGLSKFLTWVAIGAGKLYGGLMSMLTMGGLWRARSSFRAGRKDKDSWQQETDHQTIPGWEGEKYDPNATKGEDVMADFRRVPTVWSYLTAGKAAEKKTENGQEVEKPLDPVVSVLVDQPKSGSSQSMDGSNMGHAMLGIEYSRKSLISNRYERYKIQYGFYPAALLPSASALMMKDNAVIPGQLIDDHNHTYDVSRSYPAKPSQVNAIFQASEKYADGGYGFYDRNCATFVKEMVVNKARLATGGDIFERTEVEFSNLANAVMMGAEASDENVKAGTENMFLDFSEQDDESYLKYGNKKATYRDLQNYKNSLNKGSNWTKKTYVPGRLAERMRRMEGEGTGEIGTRKYSEGLRDEKGNLVLTLGRLYKSIGNKTADISEKLTIIFPPGQNQQIPLELRDLIIEINGATEPIEMINEKIAENLAKKNEGKKEEDIIKQEDIDEEYFIGPNELRTARQDLSESISKVNIILNNYLKNDKRIHNEMMDLISLLNYAVEYMDDLYRKTARGGRSDGKNPDNIREKMTQQEFTVKEDGQTAKFTPSHYESYIQIYKDPKIAVAKYNRLKELKQKKEEHGDWAGDNRLVIMMHKAKSAFHAEDRDELTFDEYKELEKLEKMDDLADQFDNAHNYMLEKEQYSQQDIDYAFQLSYREKFGNRKGQSEDRNIDNADDFRYNYYSASGIYISLFLDKIFHGLKEEWMKGPEQGGLSMDDINSTAGARGWIDDFFTKRVKSKKNEFQMILLGLLRAMRAADPKGNITYAKVLEKVSDMMVNTLVSHNFDINSNDMREAMGEAQLTNYLSMVGDEKSFKFSGMLNSMIAACLKEVRKADLPKDRMD